MRFLLRPGVILLVLLLATFHSNADAAVPKTKKNEKAATTADKKSTTDAAKKWNEKDAKSNANGKSKSSEEPPKDKERKQATDGLPAVVQAQPHRLGVIQPRLDQMVNKGYNLMPPQSTPMVAATAYSQMQVQNPLMMNPYQPMSLGMVPPKVGAFAQPNLRPTGITYMDPYYGLGYTSYPALSYTSIKQETNAQTSQKKKEKSENDNELPSADPPELTTENEYVDYLSILDNNLAELNDTMDEDDAKHAFRLGLQESYVGTLWCGDRAGEFPNNGQLGEFPKTDQCCREHRLCPDTIIPAGSKHGLTNYASFTRLHCDCDRTFYDCLKDAADDVADAIGVDYFNVLGPQCFEKDSPIIKCLRWNRGRCIDYQLDPVRKSEFQWFDNTLY